MVWKVNISNFRVYGSLNQSILLKSMVCRKTNLLTCGAHLKVCYWNSKSECEEGIKDDFFPDIIILENSTVVNLAKNSRIFKNKNSILIKTFPYSSMQKLKIFSTDLACKYVSKRLNSDIFSNCYY